MRRIVGRGMAGHLGKWSLLGEYSIETSRDFKTSSTKPSSLLLNHYHQPQPFETASPRNEPEYPCKCTEKSKNKNWVALPATLTAPPAQLINPPLPSPSAVLSILLILKLHVPAIAVLGGILIIEKITEGGVATAGGLVLLHFLGCALLGLLGSGTVPAGVRRGRIVGAFLAVSCGVLDGGVGGSAG